MSDSLVGLFEAQAKIQTLAYGRDPREITDPVERIQFIRDMREALEAELQEMMDEIGWKPWATSKHVNEEAGGKELSDVMLFFINLCFAFRVTPQMLAENTFEKMQRNLDRQLAGYDGVIGKCSTCGRAMDDTAVRCYPDPKHPGYSICFAHIPEGQ